MVFHKPNKLRGNSPVLHRGPRTLTKTDVFQAEVENMRPVDIVEDMRNLDVGAGQGDQATVWRSSLPSIVMYKPTDNPGRYDRRVVPAANMRMNLANGWLAFCPDCGEECGDDPNDCPGRAPMKYRQCPVCAGIIRDDGTLSVKRAFNTDDPNVITNDDLPGSTAEARTLNKLCLHMLAYHKAESRSFPYVMAFLSGTGKVGQDPINPEIDPLSLPHDSRTPVEIPVPASTATVEN